MKFFRLRDNAILNVDGINTFDLMSAFNKGYSFVRFKGSVYMLSSTPKLTNLKFELVTVVVVEQSQDSSSGK